MRNLLEEGNALFRDGNWENAGKEFSEGLNVSHYAAGEDIQIPKDLLESLFVNRAAAYQNMVRYICCCVIQRYCATRRNNRLVSVSAADTDVCEDVGSIPTLDLQMSQAAVKPEEHLLTNNESWREEFFCLWYIYHQIAWAYESSVLYNTEKVFNGQMKQ